jgi:hypothetical protein
MISYLFLSVFLAVLGLAAVVTFLAIALPRARRRRELARHKGEIRSQQELEDFIRQVDQAASDEQIDRLDNERKDRG